MEFQTACFTLQEEDSGYGSPEHLFITGPNMPHIYHSADAYQPSFVSWATNPFPEACPFQLKHASSDLYRIDSAMSLTGYSRDNSSRSTYSARSERNASPSVSDAITMSPGLFPMDYCYTEALIPYHHNRTTSMSNVQNFADSTYEYAVEHEPTSYVEFDPHYTLGAAHDGYIEMDQDITDIPMNMVPHTSSNLAVQSPEALAVESPVLRQRRPAARTSNIKSAANDSRISKRATPKRAATFTTTSADDSESEDDEQAPLRPFRCPLTPHGCESTFNSKNEWKRHFGTQHMRLEYWRCDKCPTHQGRKPNDFNRRDLFTQHVRRMHVPQKSGVNGRVRSKTAKPDNAVEQEVAKAAERCYRRLRSPPSKSICIVCTQSFSGPGSWEERMEHIGRHFESLKREDASNMSILDVDSWNTDTDAERWMIDHGILNQDGKLVALNDDMGE